MVGEKSPAQDDVAQEDPTTMTSASLKEKPVRDLARATARFAHGSAGAEQLLGARDEFAVLLGSLETMQRSTPWLPDCRAPRSTCC